MRRDRPVRETLTGPFPHSSRLRRPTCPYPKALGAYMEERISVYQIHGAAMNLPRLPNSAVTVPALVATWVVGFYAIWQGVGIITGGPQRFTGPSFSTLRAAPNATVFWGTTLVVAGVLVLMGSVLQRLPNQTVQTIGIVFKVIGLFSMATWSFCFAWGASNAAHSIPTIANTGGKTYACLGLLMLVLAFYDERTRRV